MRFMPNSSKWFWSACLVGFANACAGDVDRPSLARQTVEMQAALDGVQAELESHHRDMRSTHASSDIAELERRHMEAMVIALHGLRDAQDGIALCGQHMSIAHHRHELDAMIEQNAKLGGLIDEGYREVGRHWRAVDEAVLESRLDEERDYGRVMASFLSDMRAGCDAMTSTLGTSRKGGSMECPAYTNGGAR